MWFKVVGFFSLCNVFINSKNFWLSKIRGKKKENVYLQFGEFVKIREW